MKTRCDKENCSLQNQHLLNRNSGNTLFPQESFFKPDISKTTGTQVQKQGTTTSDCVCSGPRESKEIHIKLGGTPGVKIFFRGGRVEEFTNIITGPSTSDRVRCEKYRVLGKQRVSGDGLLYFVNYHGGFGFHSNYHIDRADQDNDGNTTEVLRIPGARSAGCVRLNDTRPPASSGERANRGLDSKRFYNNVSEGDLVRVYSRRAWQTPNYRPNCHQP